MLMVFLVGNLKHKINLQTQQKKKVQTNVTELINRLRGDE